MSCIDVIAVNHDNKVIKFAPFFVRFPNNKSKTKQIIKVSISPNYQLKETNVQWFPFGEMQLEMNEVTPYFEQPQLSEARNVEFGKVDEHKSEKEEEEDAQHWQQYLENDEGQAPSTPTTSTHNTTTTSPNTHSETPEHAKSPNTKSSATWKERQLQKLMEELTYPHKWLVPTPSQAQQMTQVLLDLAKQFPQAKYYSVRFETSSVTTPSGGLFSFLGGNSSHTAKTGEEAKQSSSGTPTHTVYGRLYVWDSKSKVIITDIDGTITKSDVRGHIFTRMGFDYAHSGVASLLSNIDQEGVKVLYLTARPITLHKMTRDYLSHVTQSNLKLPEGPLITAFNSMTRALLREVIFRRPDTLKIYILDVIGRLFAPEDFKATEIQGQDKMVNNLLSMNDTSAVMNDQEISLVNEKMEKLDLQSFEDKSIMNYFPFIMGFGNRVTDDKSYIAIGIDPKFCFRVDKKGVVSVAIAKEKYLGGYTELAQQIPQFLNAAKIK